ncbi:dTDP-4-dehydrorhamnose reductase family protein [Pseudomonas sp. GG8]
MKVLLLGVTGMLGNAAYRAFCSDSRYEVWGTLRNASGARYFAPETRGNLISGVDVSDFDSIVSVFNRIKPDVVINCVGLIKQLADANNPLSVLPINAMLPHRLSLLCGMVGARLVHISTDCVFSGRKGQYTESDTSDADDLYGKSKFIGELQDIDHAITLRTSIIGHELASHYALVDWFLSQDKAVKGFSRAIFSGLPTIELARVIKDFVLPNPSLNGLYHVSVEPISKFSLLKLVAEIYDKKIDIIEDDSFKIDRSLVSERFKHATGYNAPAWPALIQLMHSSR